MEIAELITMRDALFRARLSGAKEYKDQNGEAVRYASDREMSAALAAVNRAISEAETGRSPSTIVFQTSKGLDR